MLYLNIESPSGKRQVGSHATVPMQARLCQSAVAAAALDEERETFLAEVRSAQMILTQRQWKALFAD